MNWSATNKFARYYSAVRYIESLGNISGGYQKTNLKAHPRPQMFLERMRELLNLLGNPEKGFKYIHITGTAGKGSVSSAVYRELVKAGKRAGLFTSPFVVSTIEKIQTGKKYADPFVFAELTEKIKPMIDKMIESGKYGAPSYFEMIFALALLYFKMEKCEYVTLEVGLGGRYDATNVIRKPLVTAITNIDLDHTNILGSKRTDIALDKAGIIKKGSKFFTTESDRNILKIFKDECEKAGTKYHFISTNGLDYNIRNSLLATHICYDLGIINSPANMVLIPDLPARFEIVERKPFVIIDGAHNPGKMASVIFNLRRIKYRKLLLIIAISEDKDWRKVVSIIAPRADIICATRFSVPGRQPVSPDLLMREVRKCARDSARIYLCSDPVNAFKDARNKLYQDDALLVTGSFYLAGDIRALYYSEDVILRNRMAR